jgi:membrane-associated phospholipid phosphatase
MGGCTLIRLKNYISSHRHFYTLLALLPILAWFKLLELYLVPKHIIEVPLDDRLPLIPVFVIPYLLWFIYIAFGCVYVGHHSKENFLKLIIFLGGGMSVAYAIYMIFPNAVDLRPSIFQKDILSQIVKIVYMFDTPTNVCPSVHVINGMATHLALTHTSPFKENRILTASSAVLFILICLSTIFVKQHSVVDVAGGLGVGFIIYVLLYSKLRPFSKWQRVLERFGA